MTPLYLALLCPLLGVFFLAMTGQRSWAGTANIIITIATFAAALKLSLIHI